MNVKKLGFHKWFQDKTDPVKLTDYQLARVIAVNRNSYVTSDGKSDTFAEVTGKLVYNANSPLDYPTVGDWVYVQSCDDSFAVIQGIVPRKSLLIRKTSGKRSLF